MQNNLNSKLSIMSYSKEYKNKTKKSHKIVTFLILILFIYLIYLGISQIIKENVTMATTNQEIIVSEEFADNILEQEEVITQTENDNNANRIILTDEIKNNINTIYSSDEKRAFLTFDDGPSENTLVILDVLEKYDITATFFVLGSEVDKNPEIVKQTYENGHYIANHGYTHIYSSIYQSAQEVLNEFNMCNESIRNAIGIDTFDTNIFRFPGGSIGGEYQSVKDEAKILLEQNNIMSVDWNALTGDSEISEASSQYQFERLIETTNNKNSVVILMHDSNNKDTTAENLEEIIKYLQNEGYEFKSFYDLI